MKKYDYIFFIFLFTSIKSQNTDLDIVKSNIITQFSKIEDYQVDINIKINMTGLNAKKEDQNVF